VEIENTEGGRRGGRQGGRNYEIAVVRANFKRRNTQVGYVGTNRKKGVKAGASISLRELEKIKNAPTLGLTWTEVQGTPGVISVTGAHAGSGKK